MDEATTTLIAMGFNAAVVENALQVTAGNLELAANYLLSTGSGSGGGGGTGTGAAAAAATSGVAAASTDVLDSSAQQQFHFSSGSSNTTTDTSRSIVRGNISQYSVPDGRSACTYMALQAAVGLLERCANSCRCDDDDGNDDVLRSIITPAFIDDMVLQGSQLYREQLLLPNRDNSTSSVEEHCPHTSAEDALQQCPAFSKLQLLPGGIRQGLLSHNPQHPLGLLSLLASCQQNDAWTGVVLTKTPETVLVLLPPASSRSTTRAQYLWIDSHPRPGHYEPAACLGHPSLVSLVQTTAAAIFPVTSDLGPDVPELITTMYNSFDLYPLQWNSNRNNEPNS